MLTLFAGYVFYTRLARPNPVVVRLIRVGVGLMALTGLVAYLVMAGRAILHQI